MILDRKEISLPRTIEGEQGAASAGRIRCALRERPENGESRQKGL